jgi:hypothetical protein
MILDGQLVFDASGTTITTTATSTNVIDLVNPAIWELATIRP